MNTKRIALSTAKIALCALFVSGCLQNNANAQGSENGAKVNAPKKLYDEKIKDKDVSTLTYDFGVAELMDPGLIEYNPEVSEPVSGLKHIFVLENRSDKPITIKDAQMNIPIAEVKVFQYIEMLKRIYPDDLPYTVPPHDKATILVGFDPFIVFPGPLELTIDLIGEKQPEPLATFVIKGVLDNGIKFSPNKLDFGRIEAGSTISRMVNLSVDRRVQNNIPGAYLILDSTHPNLRVSAVPAVQNVMGVKIQADKLRFPIETGKIPPRDLKLKVKASVLDTLSLGKFSGNFNLIVPGFPRYLLTRSSEVWFEGEIVGHMKTASNVATFGTTKQGVAVSKEMSVSCVAPVTVSTLRVTSSNKYITARLKLPPADMSGAVSNVAKLEMTVSPQAPVGKQSGKVTVTNTINKEHIDIRTYATVIH